MGKRKWRPSSFLCGRDLEVAHITSPPLPVPALESHDYLSTKEAGNRNFSKAVRLGVLFLKGRREWTLGDNLLSFSRGNELRQMDLCFSCQSCSTPCGKSVAQSVLPVALPVHTVNGYGGGSKGDF